jgi:phospholipid/cholesterol/gamma-HCH transport system permease protein
MIQMAIILREIFKLLAQTIERLVSSIATSRFRARETSLAIVQIGIGSLPIVVVCTAFAGMVVTNEMAFHMDLALHTVQMMPGFSAQFILRELGIVIPALLLVAKVGASITAEVGTMKVTEQIDALKLLGIDPVGYLVVPRFIASIVASICLTCVSVAVTLACAITIAVVRYDFTALEYLNSVRHFVGGTDIACALVKGAIYGAVIPIISCTYGFRCEGGAEGVGTATTDSVVASTIAIILLDFVLTYLFTLII